MDLIFQEPAQENKKKKNKTSGEVRFSNDGSRAPWYSN